MADKVVGDNSDSLFLPDNGQEVITICFNNCVKLKRELQETLNEFKSLRLINELLQTELNASHMAKHVSTKNVNKW
jgi:regulator of replication initiation timing